MGEYLRDVEKSAYLRDVEKCKCDKRQWQKEEAIEATEARLWRVFEVL